MQQLNYPFNKTLWINYPIKKTTPGKRWAHTSLIFQNFLHIIAGQHSKNNSLNYKLNLQTFQFFQLQTLNSPSKRDSHTSVVLNNKIYIWGGSVQGTPTNQLWSFSTNYEWKIQQQYGQIPQKRQGHCMNVVNERFILMCGGINQNSQLLNDFFLLDTLDNCWKKIKKICGNQLIVYENCSLSKIGTQFYLFGGQKIQNTTQYFLNDLYKITLSNINFQNQKQQLSILITAIQPQDYIKPQPRAQHISIPYQNRYLIIIGGQGYLQILLKNVNNTKIKNDVWIYDTLKNTWFKIYPLGKWNARMNFSASLYKDEIIIYGGMFSANSISNQLTVLKINCDDYTYKKYIRLEKCSHCKSLFRCNTNKKIKQTNQTFLYQPIISYQIHNSFLLSIANQIDQEYQAVGRILQACKILKTNKVKITQQQNLIIQSSSNPLNPEQFKQLFYRLDNFTNPFKFSNKLQTYHVQYVKKQSLHQLLSKLTHLLLISSLRLSQVTIFINIKSNIKSVCLIDSTQQIFRPLIVELNIQNGTIIKGQENMERINKKVKQNIHPNQIWKSKKFFKIIMLNCGEIRYLDHMHLGQIPLMYVNKIRMKLPLCNEDEVLTREICPMYEKVICKGMKELLIYIGCRLWSVRQGINGYLILNQNLLVGNINIEHFINNLLLQDIVYNTQQKMLC